MKKNKNTEMSFLDHVEELRWHLIRSIIAILVIAIAAFIYKSIVFDVILIAPKTPEFITNRLMHQFAEYLNKPALSINSKPFNLISIRMAGQFSTHIIISLLAGFIVAFPYIFWEFWRFISPALYKKERTHARGAVFYTSFLFLLGVLFGYFIIVPLSVHFLGSYSVSTQVSNEINLMSYISTVASVTLASGIVFELPILVYFLSKIGLVNPRFLKKYRKHSVVVILTLAAIITPPDIFSQILVAIPLTILYEVGISISRRIERRDAKRIAG
ncbi:MAG: twin-arginine translocase subunit TatC [Bacteroidales bacterium]|nr:twin-arginine translocase subunit TatC [Bacteroidales bacterium]